MPSWPNIRPIRPGESGAPRPVTTGTAGPPASAISASAMRVRRATSPKTVEMPTSSRSGWRSAYAIASASSTSLPTSVSIQSRTFHPPIQLASRRG
jgi:hypothetical protein